MTIGQIVQEYDYDKRFPTYGFGAKITGQNATSHCFPLTFDPTNPEVQGVEGILHAYANSFRHVSLDGPTCFAPIIEAASVVARQSKAGGSQKYIVMLILTDGAIMDMPATRKAIVAACDLPLSIIIVGVGHADFASMEALDGDGGILKDDQGQAATRDIVQFVSMQKYNRLESLPQLAKETLIEVPRQLEAYMMVCYVPFSVWLSVSPSVCLSSYSCVLTTFLCIADIPLHGITCTHAAPQKNNIVPAGSQTGGSSV
jgi:hypothetical protein